MGFRFRRSVKLIPGVRLNLSKSGASVSLGSRGLRYTIGPKGNRTTVGLPGTGLSWTDYRPHAKYPASAGLGGIEQLPVHEDTIGTHAPTLNPIQSASAREIAALSTSELAPILDQARKRRMLSPIIIAGFLFGALLSSSGANEASTTAFMFCCLLFGAIAVRLDRYRRSVAIEYAPTGLASEIAGALTRTFQSMVNSAFAWTIEAAGSTADWKRNAGATHLNKRKRIRLRLGHPLCIRGAMDVPCINFGAQALYFLPDAALFIDRRSVAALRYGDTTVSQDAVRFIEEEAVPNDTTVVGQTWRFVNRNGGPDRQFNNNRQLPVCLYSEVNFLSSGGLNGRIQLSNPKAGEAFVGVVNAIATHANTDETTKSVRSYKVPSRWPTTILIVASLLSAMVALVAGSVGLETQPVAKPQITQGTVDKKEAPILAPNISSRHPANERSMTSEAGPIVIVPPAAQHVPGPRPVPPIPLPRPN